MNQKYVVGIDMGTYHVKVAIIEESNERGGSPQIIGSGHAESKGMRYGYIISTDEARESIKTALRQAEQAAGVTVREAMLAVGGVSLDSISTSGSVIVSRGDGEVSDIDINRLNESLEENLPAPEIVNKRILHTIPQRYFLDGKPLTGSPIGLTGVKLECHTLFITCFEQHLHDLIDVVESLGVSVTDIVASPLAAGLVTLTSAQKMAGCVLANIGSETVTVVVYEDNLPISLTVLPIGSNDITNDIALGLKIPLDEAQALKHGNVSGVQSASGVRVSKKKLSDIINARLTDIFELINAHLKKIKKDGILPAGVILTGGGSSLAGTDMLAKDILELPAKTSNLRLANNQSGIRDASWSVVYGLGVIGLSNGEDRTLGINHAQEGGSRLWQWFKQFLP